MIRHPNDQDRVLASFVADMVTAVDRYREAKKRYQWLTESYTCDDDGHEKEGSFLADAKRRASGDHRRQESTKEAEFWANEAQMYASVVTALCRWPGTW